MVSFMRSIVLMYSFVRLLYFFHSLLTVQMREIVDVAQDVFGYMGELLQAQLEYPEGDILVFRAVVLHQGSRHEHVVTRPSGVHCSNQIFNLFQYGFL